MENLFSALQSCKLFNGLPSELIRTALLPCAQGKRLSPHITALTSWAFLCPARYKLYSASPTGRKA
jgi:hypothetical protein